MVIDYKDISFSFKNKKKKKLIKRLKIILLVLLIIVFYFVFKSFVESKKIENLQTLLLQNRTDQVAARLKKIERSLFYRDTKKELKALVFLFDHEISKAELVLEKLGNRSTRITYKKFLDYFLGNARYSELKIYTDYLLKKGKDTQFYKILVETAFFNVKQSKRLIRQLSSEEKTKNKKVLHILDKVNNELESGRINYISDVNGIPLASYDIEKKQTVPLTPGFDFSSFEADLKNSLKLYKLTLDMTIQDKLHRLFRDYYGSFLMLNLHDGSIIAAYSKPLNKKRVNTVFFEEYEPASIIKVLTLFTHLKYDGTELFPFNCTGSTRLNNKTFYDWRTHGKVSSYKEAFAVSCNLAFAKMGIHAGSENLSEVLEKFYFNSSGFKDLFLDFRTGSFNRNVSTDFQLAKLSVGLSNNNEKSRNKDTLVTTTTFHSALMSAFIAHNGSIYSPYLIKNVKNLLNLGFHNHKAELINTYKENRIFLKVKEAMTEVVESPRGTGRRSRVDFVKTAVKTGTSGERRKGYDAILTGFFPAGRPDYAFAFILQKAGKAEIRGALFLKDFLVSFYKR